MMESYVLIPILLFLLFVLIFHTYTKIDYNYWKRRGVPYIEPKPIIGNAYNVLTFKKSVGHLMSDMYQLMSEPFFGIWIFNKPQLIVRSPELIKHILVKDFKYFPDRVGACDPVADPVSAYTMFFMKNPDWKFMRDQSTQFFTSGKLKLTIHSLNEVAQDMQKYLHKNCCEEIDIKEVCSKYSTDTIVSFSFGLKANSFEQTDAAFRQVGRQLSGVSFANGIAAITYTLMQELVSIFKIKFVHKHVAEFLRSILMQAIEERERSKLNRNDLIDLLVKLKNECYTQDIDRVIAEGVQFFAAGQETLAMTMALTLYELCLNENIQDALREEIYTMVQEGEEISYSVVQSMKYLHKVVYETLRKYPILPFLDRRCIEDYVIPGTNVKIEKGTPVFIPIYALQHDPEYYNDPEVYDPERFTEENISSRHQFTYLPFGSGPRNCIGDRFGLLSVKIGLISMLSQFEVRRSANTVNPFIYDMKSFTLGVLNGLPMHLVPLRQKTNEN